MVAGCCMVLLCGLPGVGKSTFALKLIHALSQTNNHKTIETLKKEFSSSCSVIHTIYLCFDDIIPEELYSDVGLSHDKSLSGNASETAGITWKGYREKIYEMLSLFLDVKSDNKLSYLEKEHSQLLNVLSQSTEKIKTGYVCECWESAMKGERCDGDARHVIVIDDNMFYSSMRYQYYQLARKHAIGFLEVHLICDMDVLLKQNSSRSTQVSDDTIRHMSSVFEAPDPPKNKWESNSLKYNTTQDMFDIKLLEVFKLIDYCFKNPEQPFEEENPAEKETACQVNLTNIIHQADQVIRKVISTEIKRLKGLHFPKEELQRESMLLNSKRKAFMSALKKSSTALQKLDSLMANNGRNKDVEKETTDQVCELASSGLSCHDSCVTANKYLAPVDVSSELLSLKDESFEGEVQDLFNDYNQEDFINTTRI